MSDYDTKEVLANLKQAAKENRLVFFVGTGVSMNVGTPNWDGFANEVLKQLNIKGIIDHGFIEQIKQLSPKRRLSLAKSLAEKNDYEINYKDAIEPKSLRDSQIYEIIKRLKACYVTTNYDTYLHETYLNPFEEDSDDNKTTRDYYLPEDGFSRDIIKPNNVIHLHGSYVNGNEDLVVTVEDYIDHYNEPGIQKFLEELFTKNYTIVFVGYSLEEIEILDYLFLKGDEDSQFRNQSENIRYWLQGYYKFQWRTYESLKDYYRDTFDIEMLLYPLDKNKYDELTNILRKWVNVINAYLQPSTDKKQLLDEVLTNG